MSYDLDSIAVDQRYRERTGGRVVRVVTVPLDVKRRCRVVNVATGRSFHITRFVLLRRYALVVNEPTSSEVIARE